MRTITATNGQSVFDVALLYCGDISFAFPIAELNGININKTFDKSEALIIPDDKTIIAKRFEQQGTNFATGIMEEWILESGFWNDMGIWMDEKIWID